MNREVADLIILVAAPLKLFDESYNPELSGQLRKERWKSGQNTMVLN
jgi:hypothetical protein